MKKIIFIIFSLLITKYVESKESLFTLDSSCDIVATIDSNRTIGLNISKEIYNDILKNKPDNYQITLPFFGSEINLFLENFSVYEDNININFLYITSLII